MELSTLQKQLKLICEEIISFELHMQEVSICLRIQSAREDLFGNTVHWSVKIYYNEDPSYAHVNLMIDFPYFFVCISSSDNCNTL